MSYLDAWLMVGVFIVGFILLALVCIYLVLLGMRLWGKGRHILSVSCYVAILVGSVSVFSLIPYYIENMG